MSAPPWGHKPPAVPDVTVYWTNPPPETSERCKYWLRRYRQGSWTPNRRIKRYGYHSAAQHLGIWIWEYWNVMEPLMSESTASSAQTDRDLKAALGLQVLLDEIWLSCKSVQ